MVKMKTSKHYSGLKLNYSGKERLWLTSGYTLKRLVGVFGMALPILLPFFLHIFTGHMEPLNSICHYYFTRVAGIYIMTVTLIIIYLILYQGKDPVDFHISTIAGVSAIFYLLFPTSNISNICNDVNKIYSVTVLPCSTARLWIHDISAGIFLLTLAGMAIFLFTRSDKPREERKARKKLRNRIYRTCGVIIIVSVVIIILGQTFHPPFFKENHMTFWMEAIAIESFGFSWFVKGRTIFKDK
jgi:hypothetical protein